MSSPMEVCKSDMISCAIERRPSEAAFDVWPPKTERVYKPVAEPGQATIFCPRSALRRGWCSRTP
jgi:hypothetical protein